MHGSSCSLFQRCLWVFQYNARTCLRGEKRKGSLPHPAPSMKLPCERERERGFIPPGAKHLKGNRLSTSQSLHASHWD
jgi:hypothetical protein